MQRLICFFPALMASQAFSCCGKYKKNLVFYTIISTLTHTNLLLNALEGSKNPHFQHDNKIYSEERLVNPFPRFRYY